MEFGISTFLQQSKGNFLYSIATIQLTMDYLSNALEDGVVDSLLSHGPM